MNRTYEQLLHTKNCKNTYCHDCKSKTSCVSEKHMVSELSGDLLEARELIKEMREYISGLLVLNEDYPVGYEYRSPNMKKHNAIIERTKEYAE